MALCWFEHVSFVGRFKASCCWCVGCAGCHQHLFGGWTITTATWIWRYISVFGWWFWWAFFVFFQVPWVVETRIFSLRCWLDKIESWGMVMNWCSLFLLGGKEAENWWTCLWWCWSDSSPDKYGWFGRKWLCETFNCVSVGSTITPEHGWVLLTKFAFLQITLWKFTNLVFHPKLTKNTKKHRNPHSGSEDDVPPSNGENLPGCILLCQCLRGAPGSCQLP